MDTARQTVEKMLESCGRSQDHLIQMLQHLQNHYGYLPEDALKCLSELTGITPARITECATFYASFRLKPSGKHNIRVCVGAACHVKGAENVYDSFRRVLGIEGAEDTDQDGLFTVGKVACLGCCMLAPAVQIDDQIYGWVEPSECDVIIRSFLNSADVRDIHYDEFGKGHKYIGEAGICLCSSCSAAGSRKIYSEAKRVIDECSYNVRLRPISCSGMSYRTPLLRIITGEGVTFNYGGLKEEQLSGILSAHFKAGNPVLSLKNRLLRFADGIYGSRTRVKTGRETIRGHANYELSQVRITTANSSELTPLDIDEYIAKKGFSAMDKALAMKPDEIISEVMESGLRGRGGGGFPTHLKWAAMFKNSDAERYVVCNADEGDPGAFMDRMLLESFPFRVIEGMLIAAHAVGAPKGIIYIREEYTNAVKILKVALEKCRSRGILPMKSGFNIELFTGAGAFVCGEETALIASMEGRRGTPSTRPPYPTEKGFHGHPTLINNVETLATIPWIISNSGASFAEIGTEHSRGTKTFALAGKIKRGGLIEIPMGMTIRRILEDIGGGAENGRSLKAVQIGGPSGGCIPESLFDLHVDFDELVHSGAIMGSGGLVSLDDRDCMVDMAKYFLAFTAAESCGKCVFCRIGSQRMLDILQRITDGQGKTDDLDRLEELGQMVRDGSMCGLGRTAPNPALSAIKHFREEFSAHIAGKCPAGKCRALTKFIINDKCTGCTLCAQNCPGGAIIFKPYEKHSIIQEKCVKCGVCRNVCPEGAVEVDNG